MFEDLGARFWLGLAGVMIAGAVILFITLLLFTHVVYEWGILGALLLIAVISLIAAWFYDRRHPERSSSSEY